MKRLYELLDIISDEKLKQVIKDDYNEEEIDIEMLFSNTKKGIFNMKQITPSINNNIICCIYTEDYDIDFSQSPRYKLEKLDDCFMIEDKEMKEFSQNPHKLPEKYSIDIGQEWDEMLGSFVFVEKDEEYDFEYGLCSIILDLMFMGYTQEIRQKEMKEMERRLEEVKNNKDMSHYYTEEEFMEKLMEGIDEQTYQEMKEEQRLYELHRKEIDDMTSKMIENNQKHFESICIELAKKVEYEK